MIRLRSCSLVILSLLLFDPTYTLSAQTSLYGAVALNNYVLYNHGDNAAKSDTVGFLGGVFYNFPIQSRLTAGIDVRGGYGVGARGGALGAAALRIGFVPTRVILRPYFEIGAGVVTSTFTSKQITGPAIQGLTSQPTRFTSGGAEFACGLDFRLTDSLDLRAVELGAAASGGSPSVGSAFLDAGLVYHLHPRSSRR